MFVLLSPAGTAAVAVRHRGTGTGVFPKSDADPARVSRSDVFRRDVSVVDVKLCGSTECGRELLDKLVFDTVGDRSYAGCAQLQCTLQLGQSRAQRCERTGFGRDADDSAGHPLLPDAV